jgi:hypothetical protein
MRDNLSSLSVRLHRSRTYLIPAILDQGIKGIQVLEADRSKRRAIAGVANYPPIGQCRLRMHSP